MCDPVIEADDDEDDFFVCCVGVWPRWLPGDSRLSLVDRYGIASAGNERRLRD